MLFRAGGAQLLMASPGIEVVQAGLSGADFAGAYDAIPNIAAAYGMRRLLTSYTGSLLRLRRSSDSTEQDFGYVANGDLDAAAIATFVGGGSGFVQTWYDQSGNGNNATQSTANTQPLYVASGQNSKPTIRYDNSDDFLSLGDLSAAFPSAATLVTVVTDISDASYVIFTTHANSTWWLFSGTDGYFGVFRTARIDSYPASGFMPSTGDAIISLVSSASTYQVYKNGTGAGAQAADYSAGTIHRIGDGGDQATRFLAGDVVELVLCAAALSSSDRAAAEAVANAYWAIF